MTISDRCPEMWTILRAHRELTMASDIRHSRQRWNVEIDTLMAVAYDTVRGSSAVCVSRVAAVLSCAICNS